MKQQRRKHEYTMHLKMQLAISYMNIYNPYDIIVRSCKVSSTLASKSKSENVDKKSLATKN